MSSHHLVSFLNSITIEPVVAMNGLAFGISGLIGPNMLLEKACRTELEYNETICDNLVGEREEGRIKRTVRKQDCYLVTCG